MVVPSALWPIAASSCAPCSPCSFSWWHFCSFGGFLRFAYIHATYPSQADWSLGGLYGASVNDFYTFLLDMLLPPRLGFAALALGAAVYVALFGTREPRTVEL